jgi:cation diffusion facilitator family transporter
MKIHNHHHEISGNLGTAFIISIVLNLVFVIVEGGAGILSNSMGLLSDAGHNLSDTISLLIAWIAYRLTKKAPNKYYTYGYSKGTVLASLINACILLIATGMIIVESIRKFSNPTPVNENTIIWVAAVGIVINFATALLFMKDRKKDLNVKGAFLHMSMDALVSFGVVLSGIAIKYTGWTLIDPIIGLAIAVILFLSTWDLLKQSVRLSMDGVPEQIDESEIEKLMLAVDGVKSIHHVHIWALGTSQNALTTHITINDLSKSEIIKHEIKESLKEHGIEHATIETEPIGYQCQECHCVCNNTRHEDEHKDHKHKRHLLRQ